MVKPCEGYITHDFYEKRGDRIHGGIDIGNKDVADPIVVAAYNGIVVSSGWSNSFGWRVWIEKSKNHYCVYAHLKLKPKVRVGEIVSEGEIIGIMGNTGNSKGKHLHYEERTTPYVGGEHIYPKEVIESYN